SNKHDDKTKKEAKGKSPIESSTGYRNLSVEFSDFSDNSINEVNVVGSLVPGVGKISTNSTTTFSVAGPSNTDVSPTHGKSSYVDTSQLPDDLNMLEVEDITYSDDEEDVGAEADFTNLETTITVSPIPTTRVHKDHPVTQIIGDLSSVTQTRSMTRVAKDQGGLSQITNDDFHTCMFACFLSQKEPKREEGIDYEEVFTLVARIEAIRFFLAYASFMGFMVYQMDVKDAFLYRTIEEEVYVYQPPGFEDPDYPDKVYKVAKALYGLHQAPRAWQKGDILLVQIYVDDIIFGSINKDLCKAFEKLMRDKFQMSSMGELTFFGSTNGKSASTPIDTEKPLLKDPNGEDVELHTYRSMIGSLMYLTLSRPDISPDQTVSGKDSSNPLMADNLPKIVWYSTHDVALMKSWLVQKQTALEQTTTGKEISNLFMVIITEATIQEALHLDDAESIDCLPNEEFSTKLARMGYEKPSTKLTFYKAFFSSQWKFLIHIILQCMSAKRTAWNEFSSFMALAVICLLIGAASVDVDVVPAAVEEPSIPSQDLPSTLQVQPTPPPSLTAQPPSPQQQPQPSHDAEMSVDLLHTLLDTWGIISSIDADDDVTLKDDADIAKEVDIDAEIKESEDVQGRQAESQAQIYQIDLGHADKVLSIQDDEIEPVKLKKVVEVVTTAKLITEVVTAASVTITVADTLIHVATITTAPSAARKRKGVVIRDPEETITPSTIIHTEPKSKDKGKGIIVHETSQEKNLDRRKPLTEAQAKKNTMIYLRNMAGFKMDYFKGMKYDDICPIFEKKFNSNVAFLEKIKEQIKEEDSKALKRMS
nr:hypothetical protein [Tanacetum cinerariifolium]